MSLFERKPLAKIFAESQSGERQLIAPGIAGIIGAGFFSLTGSGAADHAGSAVPRPYRTPLVPILGVVVCFAMMYSLDWITWGRLIVWLAIGLIIYFSYGRSHSHLRPGRH